MKKLPKVEIGIFGGSGFYRFLKGAKKIKMVTPYGPPSAGVAIGKIGDRQVAFLPRHGEKHQFPPHQVPYRANLYAFYQLGVKRIIAPCAAGSLQPQIKPGDFVVLDQFFDRTRGRKDTFYDGPKTIHLEGAYPYCPQLSHLVYQTGRDLKISIHPQGTVVVVNGPRFSTVAESRFFTQMGWEVINMTQYPEVILARELAMCYVGIALITDWDVGLVAAKKVKPVTLKEVVRVFKKNNEKVKRLILETIRRIPQKRTCQCQRALEAATI